MTNCVTLDMPAPPSVNNLFKNVRGGRVPTPAYDAWKQAAVWKVKAQRPEPIRGPVTILVEHGKRPGRVDPDNLFKAPLDLLVKLGLIEDDNADIVAELTGRPNVPGLTGCRVTITQKGTP
ncbi:crossover junction endodeoxyribonuclease RusA [Azospirillum baldaniorum]|uniref:RusA family crossover junction endodeoxyribonuclease n=1 Tax=Azospirillum baldaniorum TaxID=1064539 RepID=UPI0011A5F5EF|nr:RusA family crossover junction endodeoxyribonuclease [Azospirillum baldaniorum]TWA71882.1 crossover junction endodeoxyribonuclease RusA [Azospirillum baldaniorum]